MVGVPMAFREPADRDDSGILANRFGDPSKCLRRRTPPKGIGRVYAGFFIAALAWFKRLFAVPSLLTHGRDVVAVTGDHSTPSLLGSRS